MTGSRITLSGMGGKLAGLEWQSDAALRVGRLENLDIVLNESSVSRLHAEVARTPNGWVVRDLGSCNGTFVNGIRIGRTGHTLRGGELVRFGDITVLVKLDEEPAAIPSPPPVDQPRLKTSGTYVRLQAVSQQSWEQAVSRLETANGSLMTRDRHYRALLRAGQHVATTESLDELLKAILQDAVTVFGAQRGAIVLAEERRPGLQLRAHCAASSAAHGGRHFSRTLVERAFGSGQSLLCQDVRAELDVRQSGSIARGEMSSIICAVLRSPRRRLGVLHLDRSPLQPAFTADEFSLADAIAACVSTGIESAQLAEQQREQVLQTVTALAQMVELRDQYTGGHTQRVTTYSVLLARQLDLPGEEVHQLQIGTPLHDIGKIGIDDDILRKPGRLTDAEFEQMKAHTIKGAAIIESLPSFSGLLPIVRNHHERWDGTGYPDGLAQNRISRLARIVAVADAFDAMTSDRPYRPALPTERAFTELFAKAGTHFDPLCVNAFLNLRPQVERLVRQDKANQASCEGLETTCLFDQRHKKAEELDAVPA